MGNNKKDVASKTRFNKIYRTPPSPEPAERLEKEKGFSLDCVAVSSVSQDYSKANPKLGPVIPPFNAQKDKHTKGYFDYYGVKKTLEKTEQLERMGTSIEGPVMDKFHEQGAGHEYLAHRNQFCAGHSPETVDGHAQFMQGIRPITGYNGDFGFRRNTPWLRAQPSEFGTGRSPTH